MIVDVINILTQRSDLFIELLIEHIAISTVVIVTAGVLGGVVGILISEYSKAVKPTFNVVNFLYTIPSISMLGFLNKFTNIITDSEMAQMNYQVETEGKEPAIVAKEYLTSKRI